MMDSLVERIEDWAHARGLLDEANINPDRQYMKLVEEVGELGAGMARGDMMETQDAIGDIVVVLTILSYQLGASLPACVQYAVEEIEGRTGKTVNGVFIKD